MDQPNTMPLETTESKDCSVEIGVTEQTVEANRSDIVDSKSAEDSNSKTNDNHSSLEEKETKSEEAPICNENNDDSIVNKETVEKQEKTEEPEIDVDSALKKDEHQETTEIILPIEKVENDDSAVKQENSEMKIENDDTDLESDLLAPESTEVKENNEDHENASFDTQNDNEESSNALKEEKKEEEIVDTIEKNTIDEPISAGETVSAKESCEVVEEETLTIEQTTESIEFSVIEYPEDVVEDDSTVETIELILETSDQNNSDVIADSTIATSPEKQEKNSPEPAESSTNCKSAMPEKIEKLTEEDNQSEKNETSKTEESVDKLTKTPSTKQRSVIEDIFNDWQDENPDEECQQSPQKPQDSVEMELKILLSDEKPTERENNREKPRKSETNEFSSAETTRREDSRFAELTEIREDESSKSKETSTPKETVSSSQKSGKTNETAVRERIIRQKPLAPRPGVKVPGFLLTSPIVSKKAVSKVLKERLREQQKEFDSPGKPDIFFVKKITQRLSHKLAAASAAQVPGLVPIPQISTSVDSNKGEKTGEEKKSVDKELLAILEGDVDPDWSNLKPPSLASETKTTASPGEQNNSPPKLDPLIERELALKQLLELPGTPIKRIATKKPTTKSTKPPKANTPKASRISMKKESGDIEKSEIPSNERIEAIESPEKKTLQESKIDETRSGRKRKPTEKAREHEQMSTKRLKVFKPKVSSVNIDSEVAESASINKNEETNASATEESAEEESPIDAKNETTKSSNEITEDSPIESSSRRVETKKVLPKPSAKRKLPVCQKYIRQKMPANKKPAMSLKAKFPKKATAKAISHKRQKQRNGEATSVETKPKKKVINEIDRLLQDEGVVNLLYDVEQPGKKRLVPITKSQTKVMDLQKIQRELKIRTKLVRNAVLRLRTSNINTNKVSPRSKRSISHNNETRVENQSGEHAKPSQSAIAAPADFIFPAKIRNAADASIIIRRHSSSSFSSASASPRASIDAPERLALESGKSQENFTAAHLLRSNKRRRSQEDEEKRLIDGASDDESLSEQIDTEDDKKKTKKKKKQPTLPEVKRNRKRIEKTENLNTETFVADVNASKSKVVAPGSTVSSSPSVPIASAGRSTKKLDSKKNPKSSKQQQIGLGDLDEAKIGSNTLGKVATRSNGPMAGGKIMGKSKKPVKCKVSFAKDSETVDKTETDEKEDELSVCLAEAVTALTNDSGGPSRSGSTIPVNRNRTKGNSGSAKNIENDGNKSKLEKVQFSNNEINVQRHGNLVQLLLTPSTTTNMKNGMTLQVMQQLRETLSILKKDEECRVVLVTSTGSSFCEGLELSTILHENKEERRLRAEELANGVKEFIKSLATFNKPIVAGVQGSAVGLGVTMLPWFDLVIASDKATFSTPYGKLGQIAEGAAIFTLSHILGSATSELLLGGRTLTANEALRAGLVTRVLWPDRFQAELLPSLRAMSEQSSQSMEATKALLRHSLRKKLDAALESESYLLVQHWCSAECQAAIAAYVDEKIH